MGDLERYTGPPVEPEDDVLEGVIVEPVIRIKFYSHPVPPPWTDPYEDADPVRWATASGTFLPSWATDPRTPENELAFRARAVFGLGTIDPRSIISGIF